MSTISLAELANLEGVPSGLAAARDGIDALLRDRGLRRTASGVTVESLLRGAQASAVLEGSGSTLEDLRADAGDETAQAALRISTQVLALAPRLTTSPLQAFARIHALAGSPDPDTAGRPRDAESAQLLRELGELVVGEPASTPTLLLAAVLHAEIATRSPFASYNGLVARAVERLTLVSRGLDAKSLMVPEAGHLANRAAYESNLRGWRDGGRAGRHSWLLYVCEAYAAGAEASPLHEL